ncbi:MAG: hypothetical protein QNK04_02465 [Myxococcota bacterium]|nr:hypothetical protein [Myxococcota bacterium]
MSRTLNSLGIAATTLLLTVGMPALADDRPSREERRAERLEAFDVDGDGELSRDERDAAREERRQHREELRGTYDADGDGRLNRDERDAARADGERVGRPRGGRHHRGGGGGGGPRGGGR